MPLFEYTGLDAKGRKTSGQIDGPGRNAASKKLREAGIFPTEMRESKALNKGRRLKFASLGLFRPTAELAVVTRQLATLVGAGLALDEALATLIEQSDQPILGRILANVREGIIQGESLHESLARHRSTFPPIFISMVQVGESSGTLDIALQRLADLLENQTLVSSRIRAALAYPLLMCIVGTGVLAFLFAYVVPKITRMLQDMELMLPWPTLILIKLVEFWTNWWWLLGFVFLVVIVTFVRYRRSTAGSLRTDRLLLKIPVLGRLLLLIATARFARTLATLLQNGLPLLTGLDITRSLLGNKELQQAIDTSIQRLQEGGSLAEGLKETAVFPPMLTQVTVAGEKSGQLEEMLLKVADSYEHQTNIAISGLLSLLEPLMILFMGSIVGFVVLAILLPIFQASQGFG